MRWRADRLVARVRFVTRTIRGLLQHPGFEGTRVTPRRLMNLWLARWEHRGLRTELRSLPIKLILEATNICNLSCPACFTGDGQVGRARSHMSLELYHKLLEELGPTLWRIELCNWGEPLLGRHVVPMIEAASERGISTLISTNFSVPFDAARAERLVRSGLTVLGVSIDGARQESYEQYRVGGDLETVLRNCRLMLEAKRKLGSKTPALNWSFPVFPHNVEDVDLARSMARDLEMTFVVEKGWVIGDEWDPDGRYCYYSDPRPFPCVYLWSYAVVNNDGGIAPCCGSFYREDDMGHLAVTRSICFDCPQTVIWERWQQHLGAGGTPETFRPGYGVNDIFNYFWNRRPKRVDRTPPGGGPPGDRSRAA
jgi:pyruvate-formate lyase-activating enzyme